MAGRDLGELRNRQIMNTQITELEERYRAARLASNDLQAVLVTRSEKLRDEIAILETAFKNDNAELITDAANAEANCKLIENELREAAVTHFNETGRKSATANVGVRVTSKLVYDAAKALEWAQLNNPAIVVQSVDKKAFEALPVVSTLDFVHQESSVVATLRGFE